MAERKAQNKYYPPEWDPSKGSINTFKGSHPLRDRARKLHMGILIIRFEIPYNTWCEGCGNLIGFGVRFNAEKKRVGNYYSTPIYQFGMKCPSCANRIVIETDPKACDYKMVSGARWKNEGWVPEANGAMPEFDRVDKAKLEGDAMYRLEHNVSDQVKAQETQPALVRLMRLQERMKTDYDANSKLRRSFREEKKVIKMEKAKDDALKQRASLSAIDLLPERPEDAAHAAAIRFGAAVSSDDMHVRKAALKRKSIFASPGGGGGGGDEKSKRIDKAAEKTLATTAEVTTAEVDEKKKKMKALRTSQYLALAQNHTPRTETSVGRLRAATHGLITPAPTAVPPPPPSSSLTGLSGLVDYGSEGEEEW